MSTLDSRLRMSWSRVGALSAAVAIILLLCVISHPRAGFFASQQPYSTLYNNELLRSHLQHWEACLQTKTQPDFYELQSLVNNWSLSSDGLCRRLLGQFRDIYTLESREGSVEVSPVFREKVSKWLNGNSALLAELKHQVVFSLFNKYTHESTLFSKLRSKRPGLSGDDDPKAFAQKLIKESAASCDFCRYKEMTAFDSFGRIESQHAVAVSNVFKYEAYHGLILLKKHDALAFNMEEFLDMMSVMMRY